MQAEGVQRATPGDVHSVEALRRWTTTGPVGQFLRGFVIGTKYFVGQPPVQEGLRLVQERAGAFVHGYAFGAKLLIELRIPPAAYRSKAAVDKHMPCPAFAQRPS
jgi:hypothetical protein